MKEFPVWTSDGEAVYVDCHLDDDDPTDPGCAYIRNEHLLAGVRTVSYGGKPVIATMYYVEDPKTGVFIHQGVVTGSLPDESFAIEIAGKITHAEDRPIPRSRHGHREARVRLANPT